MTAPLLGDGVTPERPVGVSEGPSAREAAQAPTEDFRARERALAEVIDRGAFDPTASITPGRRADRQADALNAAGAVLLAGYRRVSEDDDTVEPRARVDRRDDLAYKIQRAVEGNPEVIRYDEDDWTRIADVVLDMIDELQRAASREVIDQAARQELTDAADFIERHVSQVGPASQALAPGQSFAVKLLRDRAALRGGAE